MKQYITSDPAILRGMPVVTGTRVPVARILYLIKAGESLEDIQKHFPHVPLKMLQRVVDELAMNLEAPYYGTSVL